MSRVFELSLGLCGKSDEDPLFKAFVNELGETPSLEVRERSCVRIFQKHQLTIYCRFDNEGNRVVRGALMAFRRRSENPFGIVLSDTRQIVEDKIGFPPFKRERTNHTSVSGQGTWKDCYRLDTLEFEVHFDLVTSLPGYWVIWSDS